MLATIGDLAEDLIVRSPSLFEAAEKSGHELRLHLGADTAATIIRRPGGSAANVAARAARLGCSSRFIGQVGADRLGDHLLATLVDAGVELAVRRAGRTATIVVLVHPDGERSMITDRGSSVDLSDPDPRWLDGVELVHVPLYSLADRPLADSVRTLVAAAHHRGIAISLDTSATSVLAELGAGGVDSILSEVRPALLFANEAEASLLGRYIDLGRAATLAVIEKRGGSPARISSASGSERFVPAASLGAVADTTGAGDVFAAGFLAAHLSGAELAEAADAGHRAAADHLAS